jgi:D-alanine-D-alanine ligase
MSNGKKISTAVWQRRLGQKKIAVLMGGISAEREISLRSGKMVCDAFKRLGLKVWGVDIRGWKDLVALERRRPDVALLCLHGTGGEDGAIQGVLEWMRVPYTGSDILASALAMDKARSKEILKRAGLPTAPWVLLQEKNERVPGSFTIPCVVKPNRQGSTVGITIVKQRSQLTAALRLAWKHDSQVMIEKFCPGREITVGILNGRALPVVEIIPRNEFYDFASKYVPGMSEHIIPARMPASHLKEAQRLAEAAHRALGCRGVSRVDLIVGHGGRMDILEVNTLPGMTATSLLPDAARHAGIGFEELVARMAYEALEDKA